MTRSKPPLSWSWSPEGSEADGRPQGAAEPDPGIESNQTPRSVPAPLKIPRKTGRITTGNRRALDAEIAAETDKIKKRTANTRSAIARPVNGLENKPLDGVIPPQEGEAEERGAVSDDMKIRYKAGDMAVYPSYGVVTVAAIQAKHIAGRRQTFYVLNILDSDRRIMVPVQNADDLGMRPLSSREEIDDVFLIMRESPNTYDDRTWNRIYRALMEKIRSGSIYDAAEIVRDLRNRKSFQKISFGEARILETAMDFIVKEIALVRGESFAEAMEEIEAVLGVSSQL